MTCGTTKYFKFTDETNQLVKCTGDCDQVLHWYIEDNKTNLSGWFKGQSLTHFRLNQCHALVEMSEEEATLWILTRT